LRRLKESSTNEGLSIPLIPINNGSSNNMDGNQKIDGSA
jgi:hypothetical protein